MVILAELGVDGRAAVAAQPSTGGFQLSARDVENCHVAARLWGRAMAVAATHENRLIRDDREAVRVTPLDLVELHELAALGISLREQALRRVGAQHRDDRVERAAWRVIG